MEKMLTLEDVSLILGYKKDGQYRAVRKLRKDGKLRGVKIGKKILFKESDLEDFIENQYRIQNKKNQDYINLINENNGIVGASKKQIKE